MTTTLRVLAQLLGFLAVASLIGFSEAAFLSQTTDLAVPRHTIFLATVSVIAAAGALLGLGYTVVSTIVAAPLAVLRSQFSVRAWSVSAGRPAVRRFYVTLWIGLGCLAVTLLGLRIILIRLWDHSDDAAARALVLLAVATIVLLTALASALVRPSLQRVAAWLDARGNLPWPASPLLRRILWVFSPVACAVIPLITRHHNELGLLAVALAAALASFAATIVSELIAKLRLRHHTAAVIFATWAALVFSTTFSFRDSQSWAATERGFFARPALQLMRWASDVDGDGFSSFFGGEDCAPWDAKRNPLTVVPNSTECRLVTTTEGDQHQALPLYSSQLPVELTQNYNILWIIIDAARADHVSALGYKKRTTPYLEALATESLLFSNAWAQSSATMLSIPSMFSGRNPGRMSWEKRGKRLSPAPQEMLVSGRLSRFGYRTGIVTNWYFDKFLPGMLEGFEKRYGAWLDERRNPWFSRSAPITTTLAIRFLEEHRRPFQDKPFFLVTYYEAPHAKYYSHAEGYPNFGKGDVGRYDNEIAYADRHIGFLLEYLRADPQLWMKTVVIVVADHGEEFGEHGGSEHAQTCYRESTHVPLLVRIPGLPAATIDTPVALVDILPTILETIGAPAPTDPLDGISLLVPLLSPHPTLLERPIFCSVISQTAKHGNFFRRSVRVGARALLHDVLSGNLELYDTVEDPRERHDISSRPAEAETITKLRALLDQSLTGTLRTSRLTD